MLSRRATADRVRELTPAGKYLPASSKPPFGTTLGSGNPTGGCILRVSLMQACKY